jgi:hypothetical protein
MKSFTTEENRGNTVDHRVLAVPLFGKGKIECNEIPLCPGGLVAKILCVSFVKALRVLCGKI